MKHALLKSLLDKLFTRENVEKLTTELTNAIMANLYTRLCTAVVLVLAVGISNIEF